MSKIDSVMKFEILDTVEEATKQMMAKLQESMMMMNEQWVSEEEFLKQFQMFSANYLKYNKERLGARRPNGAGSWAYPVHHVNYLIHNNLI